MAEDRSQYTSIDLPIRKLTTLTRFAEICYIAGKRDDNDPRSTRVDKIIQDREALSNLGKHVFLLYKMEDGEMRCWKQIIDIPVQVEYDYGHKKN